MTYKVFQTKKNKNKMAPILKQTNPTFLPQNIQFLQNSIHQIEDKIFPSSSYRGLRVAVLLLPTIFQVLVNHTTTSRKKKFEVMALTHKHIR